MAKIVRRTAAAKKTPAKRGRPAVVPAKRGRPAVKRVAQQQSVKKVTRVASKKRASKAEAVTGQWTIKVAARIARMFETDAVTVDTTDTGYILSVGSVQYAIRKDDLLIMTPQVIVAQVPLTLAISVDSIETNEKGVSFSNEEGDGFIRMTPDVLAEIVSGEPSESEERESEEEEDFADEESEEEEDFADEESEDEESEEEEEDEEEDEESEDEEEEWS